MIATIRETQRHLVRLSALALSAVMVTVGSIAASPAAAGTALAASEDVAIEGYETLINDPTLTDEHAVVLRFYEAVLGRQADTPGARFWIDRFDSGEWPTRRIAEHFASSDEFAALYGDATDDAAFVSAMYGNVLDRIPDQNGLAFWTEYLADGGSRGELILLVSNAPEFTNANRFPFELNKLPSLWLDGDQQRCTTERGTSGSLTDGRLGITDPTGLVGSDCPQIESLVPTDVFALVDGVLYRGFPSSIPSARLEFAVDRASPGDDYLFWVSDDWQVRIEFVVFFDGG